MGIDRERLVRRHNPRLGAIDKLSPFTVGNGEFCFTADITGLQSFPDVYLEGIPLCTLSNWGWHTEPRPASIAGETLRLKAYDTYGRTVYYPTSSEGQKDLYDWLRANPHRLHLGQVGLEMRLGDGSLASPSHVESIEQELDLWTGVLRSRFSIEGIPVSVETCCHPGQDAVAFRVESSLLSSGRIRLALRFPYGSGDMSAADWDRPHLHSTHLIRISRSGACVLRVVDDEQYVVSVRYPEGTRIEQVDQHTLIFSVPESVTVAEFTCCFEQSLPREEPPSFVAVKEASVAHWLEFWTEGGAVELSESTNPAAEELERRIVLSQYLTAIQCSGSVPPQETGLTCNSWYGKFHLEMHWWHAAHFALWNRPYLLERSLWWYQSIHAKARELAADQGYTGARWPKMVGPEGDQSPSPIAPLLIWQQPHPIFLAELCYRARRDAAVLQVYREIVFDSAEFMASFAHYDEATDRYVLGPPVIPAQENHKPEITINPAFELRYWRFGLDLAQRWRERLGLPRNPAWDEVLSKLPQMPVRDGVYLAHENCPSTFESFNYDHPSMLGAYGVLPGDPSIDPEIMRSTLERTIKDWRWDRTWGWDYPMCAMTAARLGQARTAIDMLMFDSVKNRYMVNGHVWQRPNLPLYLPANGGLLVAIAMMAAGWDGLGTDEDGRDGSTCQCGRKCEAVGRDEGSGEGSGEGRVAGKAAGKGSCPRAPGFPDDGTWKVSCERILPYV